MIKKNGNHRNQGAYALVFGDAQTFKHDILDKGYLKGITMSCLILLDKGYHVYVCFYSFTIWLVHFAHVEAKF